MTIQFSKSATHYIESMLDKNPSTFFRLSIKTTGCSGFSYAPEITKNVFPNDVLCELPNGLIIYLDAKWVHLLNEIYVDYIEENKTGLKQKRLTFTHPNESSRCGCGESFHMQESKNAP